MISPPEPTKHAFSAKDLRIEPLRDAHIPEVMTIESVSFGSHHWSEESFLNEMRNHMGHYFALMDQKNRRLLGYCGEWLVLDEAHITTVAVKPELRGCSLGEILLVHLLENSAAHGAHWVTLEVRASNYNAQNLYYKYGFESAGVRYKYYQDNNENALIMTTPNLDTDRFKTLYTQNRQALEAKLGGFPEYVRDIW